MQITNPKPKELIPDVVPQFIVQFSNDGHSSLFQADVSASFPSLSFFFPFFTSFVLAYQHFFFLFA